MRHIVTVLRPVDKKWSISGPFGEKRGVKKHKGVDFATPDGTECLACVDGVVSMVRTFNSGTRWDEKAGNRLFIENDKFKFYYAHLQGFSVLQEDKVKKGQVIGYTGSTGKVTGSHLHFDIRDLENGKFLEPAFIDV